MKSMAKSGEGFALQAGFTLAEMLVVVTIVMVVGGLSIPSFSRTIDNMRLKGDAQKLASMFQDARIRAAQDNTAYEVLVSPPGINPAQACIDLNGDGICGDGEPTTTFSAQVTLSNVGVPVPLGPAQLNYPTTDAEHSTMLSQLDTVAPGLAWNARGLPCQRTLASSPCIATGWIQQLQLQRPGGDTMYAAVTVSPTGRVKTWTFIPSGNGNGQWF